MSSETPQGDISYIFDLTLKYLQGKGQIPSAVALSSILLINNYVKKRYRVNLALDEFVKKWVELSEIEPSRFETVAQKNVDILTKIGMQINYVNQQESHTKLVPFSRRKKQ